MFPESLTCDSFSLAEQSMIDAIKLLVLVVLGENKIFYGELWGGYAWLLYLFYLWVMEISLDLFYLKSVMFILFEICSNAMNK